MKRKAIFKALSLSALSLMASTAYSASITYSDDNTQAKQAPPIEVLASKPRWSTEDWQEAKYEERQRALRSMHTEMQGFESDDRYARAEAELVDTIHRIYPGMKDYWGGMTSFENVDIVQSEGLISLNRVYLHPFEMGARYNEHGGFLSPDEKDLATSSQALTSHERMQHGLAPIGPDGQPIVLCRLNDDPRGMYFEMDRHLAWRLLNGIASNMSIEQACLSDEIFGQYWPKRLQGIN